MVELKHDEHDIKIVKDKVVVKRTMIEEYDVNEYLLRVHQTREAKIAAQNELKKDLTAVIKEIKGNKKKQLMELKVLLKRLETVEDEAKEISAKQQEVIKKAIEKSKKVKQK